MVPAVLQTYKMFEAATSSEAVVHRDVYFTNPIFTKTLDIVVTSGSSDLNMKIDFIGMTREKLESREERNKPNKKVKYSIAPYQELREEKSSIVEYDPDAICPGGTLFIRNFVYEADNDDGELQ